MGMLEHYMNDKNRRRGLVTTIVVHFVLLLLFLFIGLSYYDPKPEAGILINFGDSETGMGQEVQESSRAAASKPAARNEQEAVQTQSLEEAPSLPAQEQIRAESNEESQPQEESPEETQSESTPDPEPSQSLKDLLNKTRSSESGGEGVTEGPGDQGREDGDRNSNNRSGSGGGGDGDGNYQLGGRAALTKPRPDYPCADEGRVVVKIYVNRQGKVSRAVAGERVPGGPASTTTSSCLYEQARRAALRTTWQSDSKAPEVQAGYIVYNFRKQ